jgi:hypothetical protein
MARRFRARLACHEFRHLLGVGMLGSNTPLLGRVFHFMLRTRGWRWMIAVVSSRATRQKSECYEEYWSYDFRYCPP